MNRLDGKTKKFIKKLIKLRKKQNNKKKFLKNGKVKDFHNMI